MQRNSQARSHYLQCPRAIRRRAAPAPGKDIYDPGIRVRASSIQIPGSGVEAILRYRAAEHRRHVFGGAALELPTRCARVPRVVSGRDDAGVGEELVTVLERRLIPEDIESRGVEPAFFERPKQRFLVDDRPPRRVYEDRRRAQPREGSLADEKPSLVRQRAVEAEDVALFEDAVEIAMRQSRQPQFLA